MTVISFQDLDLADKNTKWDSVSAEKRVREWANAQDKPNDKYRKAFMWFDNENKDNFTAYKLPYADVIDDKLLAVPSALHSIASILGGGRGSVNIPQEDKDKVKNQLDKYYKKMESESDFELTEKQQDKFDKVMSEFGKGSLNGVNGKPIKDQKQAVAIAMSEARKYVDITNRVIFATGKYNDEVTTEKDLQDIVNANKELSEKFNFKPRLKITHGDIPLNLGTVENVRKVGNKLIADFKNIPTKIFGLIQENYLPINAISCEIIHNLKTQSGDNFRRVLDAVAFTGGDREALWETLNTYSLKSDFNLNTDYEYKSYFELEEYSLQMKKNKSAYEKMYAECKEMGLKMKPYEKYELMDDDTGEEYLEDIASRLADRKGLMALKDTQKKYELEIETLKKVSSDDSKFNKDDVKELMKKYELDVKENTRKEVVEEYESKLEVHKKEIEELKKFNLKVELEAEKKNDYAFVKELITANKILPNKEKLLLELFENMPINSEKKAYSLGENQVKGTIKEQLKNFLNSFESNSIFSNKVEYARSEDGIAVTKQDREEFLGLSDSEIIEQKRIKKRIYELAKEGGIDISLNAKDSFAKYLDLKRIAESEVIK